MRSPTGDLDVACHPVDGHGGVAFIAERRLPLLGSHWVLYLSTDQTIVDIQRVAPPPLGEAMFADGALGLLFPSTVRSVRLDVAGDGREQHWRFWLAAPPSGSDASRDLADTDCQQEPS